MEEKMIIVNVGEYGITKVLDGEKGAVREKKFFPPNIPIECSKEMAIGLLKKHNDPTKQIIFRSAEGFALANPEAIPIFKNEAEEEAVEKQISDDDPMKGYVTEKKKRGRKPKK